ncbi:MAG: sensor histidine kinase [bacterium]
MISTITRLSKISIGNLEPGDIRGLLRTYLTYRVVLAAMLAVLLATGLSSNFLGTQAPGIYGLTVVMYLVLTIASISLCQCDLTTAEVEYLFAILVDSLAISLFMYTSGGLQSGLGILLGVSVAFGGLGLPRHAALLAAAIASLALLGTIIYLSLAIPVAAAEYTQSGLLGVAYFAIALLAHQLATRVAVSEQLARQRGADVESLTKLNEYVIQGMQSGVIVVDHDHTLRLINDSAWSLLGLPDSRLGEPLSHASSALDIQFREWLRHPFTHKIIFRTNPDSRDLQASFRPLGDSDNQGTLIFIEDTGWLMEQAQQIKLASLGKLTASIAHEIRNPLSAINHAAQLLSESEDLDATDKRMTEIIGTNSSRVNDVIENILSMSRRSQAIPEEFALTPWLESLCAEIVSNHALLADQITVRIDPEDTLVYADRQQLHQVLTSLCDNSVSHFDRELEELSIQITAGITPDSKDVYIQIVDNGPGIPADLATKIFDPFFTTRHDGTGLGLYITRELCEANNIRLEYIPVSIGGSCFKLTLSRNLSRPYESTTSTHH